MPEPRIVCVGCDVKENLGETFNLAEHEDPCLVWTSELDFFPRRPCRQMKRNTVAV